ncbi:MAG: alpha/beta hydrolase [Solirubrobacterales bacterium]
MGISAAEQERHLRAIARLNALEPPSFRPAADHEVTVGGVRLHYLDWGDPGGDLTPLLFLHGGGLNAHTWDLTCLMLRERHHCVAPDLRGHGDSDWSAAGEYAFTDHADDVEALLDRLGLTRPVLIGMSLGALTSIEVAARRGDRLGGVVLVDAGPRLRSDGTDRIRRFTKEDRVLPSVEDFVARALRFNPRRDPDVLTTSLRHNLRELPDGNWTWKYDPRHIGGTPRPVLQDRLDRLGERLARITVPTLVVRGGESDVFAPADAEELARRLPGGRLVTVPGAGHTVQGDNPAGFLAALAPFLREVAVSRSSPEPA